MTDEPISRMPLAAVLACLLALVAVVALTLRSAPPGSEIRIRNNTAYPFDRVVVNGEQYGSIDSGKFSAYRNVRPAFRYASVRLHAGAREMHLIPDDFVGETPLGRGKFTYVLNIVDGDRIDLAVEKEPL